MGNGDPGAPSPVVLPVRTTTTELLRAGRPEGRGYGRPAAAAPAAAWARGETL